MYCADLALVFIAVQCCSRGRQRRARLSPRRVTHGQRCQVVPDWPSTPYMCQSWQAEHARHAGRRLLNMSAGGLWCWQHRPASCCHQPVSPHPLLRLLRNSSAPSEVLTAVRCQQDVSFCQRHHNWQPGRTTSCRLCGRHHMRVCTVCKFYARSKEGAHFCCILQTLCSMCHY